MIGRALIGFVALLGVAALLIGFVALIGVVVMALLNPAIGS
jgi:hypothetical protein